MSRIAEIQALVRNGLYYLTEHADDEAMQDGFDIYDIENGILTGKTRKTWPKEGKIEVVGKSLDGRNGYHLPSYARRQSPCDYCLPRSTKI